jgi:hypothetical protein
VTETVTRLRGSLVENRYGDDEWDWSDPAELDITGCAVAPRDSTEDHDQGRQAVLVGFTVYAPAGTEILPTDRLEVRGDTWEVDGEPGVWVSPFTEVEEGVEIRTRRVTG